MRVGHHVIDLHNWPAAIETQHLVKRVRHPWYHIQHYVLIGFKVDRKLELHCGSPEYQALFHDCPLLYIIYLGLECCRFPHISHTCTCGQIFRCAWDWLPICLAKVTFVPKSLTKWIQSFAETTSRRDLLPFLNIYILSTDTVDVLPYLLCSSLTLICYRPVCFISDSTMHTTNAILVMIKIAWTPKGISIDVKKRLK